MNKILLLSASLLFLNSCGYLILKPMSNSYIKKHKTEVMPEDLFTESYTLVILLDGKDDTGSKSYNKKVQQKVKDLYHGKYKVMTQEEYATVSGEDTYRYAFTHTSPSTSYSSSSPSGSTVTARRFFILDSKTGNIYKCDVGGSFYVRVMESYFQNLEKWRLEATGK